MPTWVFTAAAVLVTTGLNLAGSKVAARAAMTVVVVEVVVLLLVLGFGIHRVVGRATLVTLVVAGALFMAQTYVGALISPATPVGEGPR